LFTPQELDFIEALSTQYFTRLIELLFTLGSQQVFDRTTRSTFGLQDSREEKQGQHKNPEIPFPKHASCGTGLLRAKV